MMDDAETPFAVFRIGGRWFRVWGWRGLADGRESSGTRSLSRGEGRVRPWRDVLGLEELQQVVRGLFPLQTAARLPGAAPTRLCSVGVPASAAGCGDFFVLRGPPDVLWGGLSGKPSVVKLLFMVLGERAACPCPCRCPLLGQSGHNVQIAAIVAPVDRVVVNARAGRGLGIVGKALRDAAVALRRHCEPVGAVRRGRVCAVGNALYRHALTGRHVSDRAVLPTKRKLLRR